MRKLPAELRRPGTVTPLAAILLVFLLGMIAFSVDMGYMVLSESELQSAADSAALAGAGQIMQGFVQYNLPGQSATNQATILANAQASARTAAKNFASYNASGGVNSLALNDSDIQFGFTDANNNYTPCPTYTGYPNTVKVTMRRDSNANGALKLFFAPVLGVKTQNLLATASATIEGGTINSFSAPPLTGLMPMTYDVNNWNNFVATGQDPDSNTTLDANGNPVLRIYPSVSAPGNFGQLSLDDNHVGESTEGGWVNNGISSSDLNALTNANLIPLSAHDSTKWDWQGDTGMKQSLVSTINNYVGTTFILPLFNPYSPAPSYSAGTGNGSHYYYQIVQFVAVKIMPDSGGGVTVQPAAVVEPNAVMINIAPAGTGTQGNTVTTFSTPKLTQ
jgi:Flp pilus assembly protein TadG